MDWARVKLPPKPHQREGTAKLIANPRFALFDEVGAGKSKQVIDAEFCLFEAHEIDSAVCVAPGSARSVWADPDPVLGEVAKHAWDSTPWFSQEYHAKTKTLGDHPGKLHLVTTNYEFIRRPNRLEPLLDWCRRHRPALVLDESWMVSNKSQQWEACMRLSKACPRVVLLNGTPGDPKAIYYQFTLLDPDILGFRNFYTFRARHAKMGGWQMKNIVGWQHMEEFKSKLEPYAVMRLTRDFFALGDPPLRTQIDVTLTPSTWRLYQQMKNDLVAWLSTSEASIAGMAGVKVLRLAQITAGFLGGVELLDGEPELGVRPTPVRQIGSEKIDGVKAYFEEHGVPDKAVIWGHFRPEIENTARVLQSDYPTHMVAKLYGGQNNAERELIKRALAPGGDPGPAIIVGHPASGGAGLNFAAASLAIYLTNPLSLTKRKQSEGRLDRPGQTGQVRFIDVLASGPDGQKTIDHVTISALRKKDDLATWTADMWRKVLEEEA
jgi:hypothetical protein